jgi:arylformamidase
MEQGMPCFNADWHIPFSSNTLGTIESVGRNTKKLTLGSHTGTHMDAPRHFIPGGKSITDIPLSSLCGDVTIIDFRTLPDNTAVTAEMLRERDLHEKVICVFGWDKHWNTGDYYANYPYFSEEAAQYLVDSNVKLLGLDTPSPDNSKTPLHAENDSVIHKLFLKSGVILVEYLAASGITDYTRDYQIIALPMKIKDSDGAPARVILIEKEK